jgi:hypothetical protein
MRASGRKQARRGTWDACKCRETVRDMARAPQQPRCLAGELAGTLAETSGLGRVEIVHSVISDPTTRVSFSVIDTYHEQ